MRRTEFELEELNSILVSEFERYVMEHLDWSEAIPKGALVVLLLEGDEDFNRWSIDMAEKHAEPGRAAVRVRIMDIEPPRSRIRHVELASVA